MFLCVKEVISPTTHQRSWRNLKTSEGGKIGKLGKRPKSGTGTTTEGSCKSSPRNQELLSLTVPEGWIIDPIQALDERRDKWKSFRETVGGGIVFSTWIPLQKVDSDHERIAKSGWICRDAWYYSFFGEVLI